LLRSATFAVLCASASALRVPAGLKPPSVQTEFKPPRFLFKPMATSLVATASKFPVTLPLAHAAMDWLVAEQQAQRTTTSRVTVATQAQAPAATPVAVATQAVAPPPVPRKPWNQVIVDTFVFAGEALVTLLATRVQLAVINLRLALRARRQEAIDSLASTIESIKKAPTRFSDEVQAKVESTTKQVEAKISMAIADATRKRDTLSSAIASQAASNAEAAP